MRNDIHSPKNIIPANYEFVSMVYIGNDQYDSADFNQRNKEHIMNHMMETKGQLATHKHGGNCQVCGARAKYFGVFYHSTTNEYVRVGHECAGQIKTGIEKQYDAFKKTMKGYRDGITKREKAIKILEECELQKAIDIYNMEYEDAFEAFSGFTMETIPNSYQRNILIGKLDTIKNVLGTVFRTGHVSTKQAEFIKSLLEQLNAFQNRLRANLEALETVPEIEEGRYTLMAEIVSYKVQETIYGPTLKFLLKDPEGRKYFGTAPKGIDSHTNPKGSRVTIKASFEPSNNDKGFGFFKRPHLVQ